MKTITLNKVKPNKTRDWLEPTELSMHNLSYAIKVTDKDVRFYGAEGTALTENISEHPLVSFAQVNRLCVLFIAKIQLRATITSLVLPPHIVPKIRKVLRLYPNAFTVFSIAYAYNNNLRSFIGHSYYLSNHDDLFLTLIKARNEATKPRYKRKTNIFNVPLLTRDNCGEFGIFDDDTHANISKCLSPKDYKIVSVWLSRLSRMIIRNCIK